MAVASYSYCYILEQLPKIICHMYSRYAFFSESGLQLKLLKMRMHAQQNPVLSWLMITDMDALRA